MKIYLGSCQKCHNRINILLLEIIKENGKALYVCPDCAKKGGETNESKRQRNQGNI